MKVYKYVFDYKFGLDVLNPTCEFKNKSSSKIKKTQSFFPFIKKSFFYSDESVDFKYINMVELRHLEIVFYCFYDLNGEQLEKIKKRAINLLVEAVEISFSRVF